MNKVFLIGRLVADPTPKTFGELIVSEFTIALDRKYNKGHQAGTVDYIPCTAFGKLGDFSNKYFTKGRKILIEGRLRTSTYQTKEGKNMKKFEVVAESVEFMEPKKKNSEAEADSAGWEDISADEVPFI